MHFKLIKSEWNSNLFHLKNIWSQCAGVTLHLAKSKHILLLKKTIGQKSSVILTVITESSIATVIIKQLKADLFCFCVCRFLLLQILKLNKKTQKFLVMCFSHTSSSGGWNWFRKEKWTFAVTGPELWPAPDPHAITTAAAQELPVLPCVTEAAGAPCTCPRPPPPPSAARSPRSLSGFSLSLSGSLLRRWAPRPAWWGRRPCPWTCCGLAPAGSSCPWGGRPPWTRWCRCCRPCSCRWWRTGRRWPRPWSPSLGRRSAASRSAGSPRWWWSLRRRRRRRRRLEVRRLKLGWREKDIHDVHTVKGKKCVSLCGCNLRWGGGGGEWGGQ